jgi:hypothetical protein
MYENEIDLDLYNIVHQQTINENIKEATSNLIKRENTSSDTLSSLNRPNNRPTPTNTTAYNNNKPNKSVLLTAKLLDSHFTNGKNEWGLSGCGCDMYRTILKSMNTISPSSSSSPLRHCANAELLFFDIQPLSTRISLMTKLMVITQGKTRTTYGLGSTRAFKSSYDMTMLGYNNNNNNTSATGEPLTLSSSSSGSSSTRSKSFDNSLANRLDAATANAREYINSKSLTLCNSGLFVCVSINNKDDTKVSVFGSDPFSRINKPKFDQVKLISAKAMAAGSNTNNKSADRRSSGNSSSSPVKTLISNFENRNKYVKFGNFDKII